MPKKSKSISRAQLTQSFELIFSQLEGRRSRLQADEVASAISALKALSESSPTFHEFRSNEDARDTFLCSAARRDSVELVSFLLDLGADPNARNGKGQSPLMLSARAGHWEVVDLLLEKGARIDLKDSSGRDALHWSLASLAQSCDNSAVIESLLQAGISLIEVDGNGLMPFQFYCKHWINPELECVDLLTRNISKELLNKPLPEHGGNIAHVIRGGLDEIEPVLFLLVNRGLDIAQRNWLGQTALHTQVNEKCDDTEITALTRLGVDVNARDFSERTALHLACSEPLDRIQAIHALVQCGARLDITDCMGRTPLDVLRENRKALKNSAVAQVLETLTPISQSQKALHILDDIQSGLDLNLRPLWTRP